MYDGTFASLGLSPFFGETLARRGILKPTEIQEKTIPRLLAGESVIFRSATGTGKTFAYLLPLLERLFGILGEKPPGADGTGREAPPPRGKPLILVAAPTLELCSQIKGEADFLLQGAPVPVRTALLIGSTSMGRQIETLKKEQPEVIVGNPGRILALARLGKLPLRNVRFLVLDEGDRLVQEELYNSTRDMVSMLAPPFLGAACSATIPGKSRRLLLPLLESGGQPAVSTGENTDGAVLRESVEHWAFFCPEKEKPDLLRSLTAALEALHKPRRNKDGGKAAPFKALIFTSRAGQAENIASRLRHFKLPAAALAGGMDKTGRKQVMEAFRAGKTRFLVSSDLASRGLDISGISYVIALDVQEDRDIYIHRAGRTARAGNTGVMVSIGTEGEMRRLSAIEKTLGIVVYPKVLYGGKILAPDSFEDEDESTTPP